MPKGVKIFFCCVLLVLLLFMLWGLIAMYRIQHPPAGVTEYAQIEVGTPERFSREEVQAAIDAVLAYFPEYGDCTLTKLWYDETAGAEAAQEYASDDDIADILVIFGSFTTGENARCTGHYELLMLKTEYLNYHWVLRRQPDGSFAITHSAGTPE